tara:strand:+ start:149955 stop:150104 length:150 start_codon:yes stop_codon:yes gene_type:complete
MRTNVKFVRSNGTEDTFSFEEGGITKHAAFARNQHMSVEDAKRWLIGSK